MVKRYKFITSYKNYHLKVILFILIFPTPNSKISILKKKGGGETMGSLAEGRSPGQGPSGGRACPGGEGQVRPYSTPEFKPRGTISS